jgi:glycosyltransferase involved in cell wall biosynthesis
LVIVIPAWNEMRRLDATSITGFLRQHAQFTIQFVDDGSTDGTSGILNALQAELPGQVGVLRLEQNSGKGEAVRRGLLQAFHDGCRMAGYLDADLAAPLKSMLLLAETLEADATLQCAIGSRVKLLGWHIHRSERRHYLGRVFATFASLTLGLPIYDTQCGAKLLRCGDDMVALLGDPFMSRWLFDVELIARIRDRYGPASMREVPLPAWTDLGGTSLRFADFVKAPWQLFRIRRRYPPRPM